MLLELDELDELEELEELEELDGLISAQSPVPFNPSINESKRKKS